MTNHEPLNNTNTANTACKFNSFVWALNISFNSAHGDKQNLDLNQNTSTKEHCKYLVL